MIRGYQYYFSKNSPYVYESDNRGRKACTMLAVLDDFLCETLSKCDVLYVDGSTGAIDNFVADHAGSVISVDIDDAAIKHAQETLVKENFEF